jgi:hypothetical protein
MAWWRDGSSNQFLIGEKHVPTDRIGISKSGETTSERPLIADSMILIAGRYRVGSMRNGILPLTNNPSYCSESSCMEQPANNPTNEGGYGFGSVHPGLCLFVLGDGAVKNIANTVPERILRIYGSVNDGGSASLP